MKNIELLSKLGLTRGEIKVYLGLFELGESTVGPISKESGVTHAKVYPILDKLIAKGLASHSIRRGRKHFCATNPDSLLELVDKQVRKLSEERANLKELIPSLKAKSKAFENAQYCRVYEGFKGLRSLFQELFENNKGPSEICVLGINDLFDQLGFVSFLRFYHDLRHKNKISLRLILNPTKTNYYEVEQCRKTGQFDKKDKTKFVKTSFPLGIFIFKDHVISIISGENVTAFDMKSNQASERYRNFFNSVWSRQ